MILYYRARIQLELGMLKDIEVTSLLEFSDESPFVRGEKETKCEGM